MEHVVFFPAHDGTPAFRRVAGLEDAVRLVEHLRNVEGISEVSVHALTEVPLAFKTWYRVEVPTDAAPASEAPAPAPVEAAVAEPVLEPVSELIAEPVSEPAADEVVVPALVEDIPEQPVVSLATSNGQAVGGSKSLGFFAS